MLLFVPKEIRPGETRAALVPSTVERLKRLGMEIAVEAGLGISAGHPDLDYENAGARLVPNRIETLEEADLTVRVRKPPLNEVPHMRSGSIHVSFLDPFRETALVDALAAQNVSAISMELIPRSMGAQGMDALSSQANLAGYVAVITAAERLNKIFPMLITPAGTIAPARVFVIGAGIAGLQAIATAKRLGARVEAYDTRAVVSAQVRALGAKFVEIDISDGSDSDSYGRGLSPEQLEKQRAVLAEVCAQSDVVITTAVDFGKPAPMVLTEAMLHRMRPGSVVVDLAAENGGNVEGAQLDRETLVEGVKVIGLGSLPSKVSSHASQMYSSNIANFIDTFWNHETKTLDLDLEHEIIKSCLVTHQGAIVNEDVRQKRS